MGKFDDGFSLGKLFKKGTYWISSRTVLKVKNHREDVKAAAALAEWQKKRSRGGKIRCCFIVQMPEVWNKQQRVYHKLEADDRFEVWMLLVPNYRMDLERFSDSYGSEKEFFEAECRNGNLIYALENGKYAEVDFNRFDYVFYQRPYDWYLPEKYQSNYVVGKAGVCYVPYATNELSKPVTYPQSFFRDIYLGFMENEHAAELNTKRYSKACDSGLQHFLNVGYPPFEECLEIAEECGYKKVLWTPRWTYAPIIGGSHFVEYVQPLMDYEWGDAELCVRPHPLMWQEFTRTGKMTQQQIDDVLAAWKERGITQDSNKEILNSFAASDILISDNSSVIPMFFLTGKPIIYCVYGSDFDPLFHTIMPGMYVAKSWEDVKKYLDQLLAHDDPLKSVREKIIKEHFYVHDHASDHIVEALAEDYFQNDTHKE